MKNYTENTDIPILKEFCYKNKIHSKYIYELADKCIKKNNDYRLNDSIKELIEKKETQLEKLSLTGQINVSQAIFSLKQLGWKDRKDIDLKTQGNFSITLPTELEEESQENE